MLLALGAPLAFHSHAKSNQIALVTGAHVTCTCSSGWTPLAKAICLLLSVTPSLALYLLCSRTSTQSTCTASVSVDFRLSILQQKEPKKVRKEKKYKGQGKGRRARGRRGEKLEEYGWAAGREEVEEEDDRAMLSHG